MPNKNGAAGWPSKAAADIRTARRAILSLLAVLVIGVCTVSFRQRNLPEVDLAEGTIAGEVRDAHGPVAGATVRFKGQPQVVWTDVGGHFRLPRPSTDDARITAWKEGYRIGGSAAAPGVVIRLTPLPVADHEEYAWVGPDPDAGQPRNCGNCHEEIYREWSASGHARSVSNRHFRNLYDGSDWHGRKHVGWSLLAEHPDGSGVCTACHGPTVGFEDPAYFDLRQARGTASRGVHCDYCHKVVDVTSGGIGHTHGRFGLKLLRPALAAADESGTPGKQLFFGPLDDVEGGEDAFAAIYRDSRYCASCHEGTVFGVPVYTTYSEWLASPARTEGKECQTCHMAPTGRLSNLATGKGGFPRDPHTLANHRFFAGSQVEMLRQCLKITIALSRSPDSFAAEVEVRTVGVGHSVPTGFVDRNLILMLEAYGADGQTIAPRSGRLLPPVAGKSWTGRPGHLYAKQLTGFDGHGPVPFWRAQPDVVDSRLVPGRPDRSTYRFPVGVNRIVVRLVYQRFWEDVANQKNWPDNAILLLEKTLELGSGIETRWSGP
ncbi:MAG TPA: multiheme c-type cytochrome [Gemmataceae bacterium]|nr:multiheme c-type cytochrome [Gemmataceae bacterium]